MAEQIEQAARTAGRTFNISLAELAGANAGQRNDLLALNQAVYRVPDGTLYTSTGSQLMLAQGLPVMAGTNPLTGGIELTAGGEPVSVGGPKVWRGVNQNMGVVIDGYATSQWSATHRSPHYTNARFRRLRVVLQTFAPTGSPVADTNIPDDYNFQVGFEAVYANSYTGIAPRKLFTFEGVTIAQYLAASPPVSGYIISDILELDDWIESGQTFGLWTTVEHVAQGALKIPYRRPASNFIERYMGRVANNSSNIANDVTRSASSITPTTSNQAGTAAHFTPTMILIETDSQLPFVGVLGASHSAGAGEGSEGSLLAGDTLGGAKSNAGFINRAIYENLGYNACNLGKGSDGNKNLIDPAKWEKRRNLLILANPTHVLNANIHNDLTIVDQPPSRANTTVYAKWSTAIANGNTYMCTKAGTSGTIAPAGTGTAILDGSVIWTYIQPHPPASGPRASSVSLANICNVSEQIHNALPGIKLIGMMPTLGASSTDQYTTIENQTPGFGMAVGGLRDYLIPLMRANYPLLRWSAHIDPTEFYEYGWPAFSSKWIVNGDPYWLTYDGTHFNSTGAKRVAACITADKFI